MVVLIIGAAAIGVWYWRLLQHDKVANSCPYHDAVFCTYMSKLKDVHSYTARITTAGSDLVTTIAVANPTTYKITQTSQGKTISQTVVVSGAGHVQSSSGGWLEYKTPPKLEPEMVMLPAGNQTVASVHQAGQKRSCGDRKCYDYTVGIRDRGPEVSPYDITFNADDFRTRTISRLSSNQKTQTVQFTYEPVTVTPPSL